MTIGLSVHLFVCCLLAGLQNYYCLDLHEKYQRSGFSHLLIIRAETISKIW